MHNLPDYITIDPHKGSLGETPAAHWLCSLHPGGWTGTWFGEPDNEAAAVGEAQDHARDRHGWQGPEAGR